MPICLLATAQHLCATKKVGDVLLGTTTTNLLPSPSIFFVESSYNLPRGLCSCQLPSHIPGNVSVLCQSKSETSLSCLEDRTSRREREQDPLLKERKKKYQSLHLLLTVPDMTTFAREHTQLTQAFRVGKLMYVPTVESLFRHLF